MVLRNDEDVIRGPIRRTEGRALRALQEALNRVVHGAQGGPTYNFQDHGGGQASPSSIGIPQHATFGAENEAWVSREIHRLQEQIRGTKPRPSPRQAQDALTQRQRSQ